MSSVIVDKSLPILILIWNPTELRDRQSSWIRLPLEISPLSDVLRPEAGLDANDMRLELLGDVVGWIVGVD